MLKRIAWLIASILIALGAAILVVNVCRSYSPTELAVAQYFDQYNIDPDLLMAIRHAESCDGKWLWSDSYSVLIKQSWTHHGKPARYIKRWGRQAYFCVGDWQVSPLTASLDGYTNSPIMLGENVYTNCRYACKILYAFMHQRGGHYTRNVIAAYNLGHTSLKHGKYVNEKYVDCVWSDYTNRRNHGRE